MEVQYVAKQEQEDIYTNTEKAGVEGRVKKKKGE
jgi:hypothetical protein